MVIRPDVGRAKQPIKDRSVVLPEPLGPLRQVMVFSGILKEISLTPINSFVFSLIKDFSDMIKLYHLITSAGSMVAARHTGIRVARIYGNTVKKNNVAIWKPLMWTASSKSG